MNFWMIVFFIVAIAGLTSFIAYFFKKSTIKETSEAKLGKNSESKKEVKKSGGGNYWKYFREFIPLFILLLFICLMFWLSNSNHGNQSQTQKQEYSSAPATGSEESKSTFSKSSAVLNQTAIVSWHKPDNYYGENRNVQSDAMKAVITRNDSEEMSFTATYIYGGEIQESHFKWDKNQKYGQWYQDSPSSSGIWYLLPYQGSNTVYIGKVTDKAGKFLDFKLEIG